MRRSTLTNQTSLALILLATACGGGGGGSLGGGGGTVTDPANSFAPKPEYVEADADHLLARTGFGLTEAARDAIARDGLVTFVDEMLSFPTTGERDFERDAAVFLQNGGDPVGLEGRFPSRQDISEWWLHMMMWSDTPFQERLALFLHDHFAVSATELDTSERHWMVDHVQKLRRNGLGNFRDLVLEMSRDPAMLEWLDGHSSVKGEPNENFAREFFELFTVGADQGYTEDDIQEASRAFTGYRDRLDAGTNLRYSEFDPERKDVFAKVLFENVIIRSLGEAEDDYALVVDATFEHLQVDRWLAEKLLLEFVVDEPTEAQIAGLATVIREEQFEMRPILRTLFLSEAFFQSRKSMVKMPVEYGVGFIRSTGLYVSAATLRGELDSLAQTPGQPPSVFGWPQGEEWLSAEGLVERANLVRRVIADRNFQRNNGFDVALPTAAPTSSEVVDHFASLLGVALSTTERDDLIVYLDTNVRNNGELEQDPFDPSDSRHLDERVRGLLYILENHVDAMRR